MTISPDPLAYSVSEACRVSTLGKTRLYQLGTHINVSFAPLAA